MNICELLESTNQQQQQQKDETNQEQSDPLEDNQSKKLFHAQTSKFTSFNNNELNHNSAAASDNVYDENTTRMDTSTKSDITVEINASQVNDLNEDRKDDANSSNSIEEKLDTGGGESSSSSSSSSSDGN